MKEIWMPIKGYEGYYEVSNLGRVRGVDRTRKGPYGKIARVAGMILSPKKNSTNDYLLVGLRKDGVQKTHLVHRLVAEAFIPNPLGLPEVNHRDENPQNNISDNLEWCDRFYNNHYGSAIDRRSRTRGIPVSQYTLDGELVATYWSAREAARALGRYQSTISRCCLGQQKQAYGFVWKFASSSGESPASFESKA